MEGRNRKGGEWEKKRVWGAGALALRGGGVNPRREEDFSKSGETPRVRDREGAGWGGETQKDHRQRGGEGGGRLALGRKVSKAEGNGLVLRGRGSVPSKRRGRTQKGGRKETA